jgi:hypothetical protein
MVELEIEIATVEQVGEAISEALRTSDPDTVLSYSRLPSGAVRVVAGSPVSPRQREATAALGRVNACRDVTGVFRSFTPNLLRRPQLMVLFLAMLGGRAPAAILSRPVCVRRGV